jgi:hypothetical protein
LSGVHGFEPVADEGYDTRSFIQHAGYAQLMLYFAYGSNMLTARLAARVPSARPVGPAWLTGHCLRFHLRGADGSGKCNILPTGNAADIVHGVLFTLNADHLECLHAAEGPAYAFVELAIDAADGPQSAAVYRGRSAWLDDELQPFAWYLDFVVTGARQHSLPRTYVDELARTANISDPDPRRAAGNRAILQR